MKKISIRLTEKQYEFLESLVISGEYANVSEVIRDAIRYFMKAKMRELSDSGKVEEMKWKGENV